MTFIDILIFLELLVIKYSNAIDYSEGKTLTFSNCPFLSLIAVFSSCNVI